MSLNLFQFKIILSTQALLGPTLSVFLFQKLFPNVFRKIFMKDTVIVICFNSSYVCAKKYEYINKDNKYIK